MNCTITATSDFLVDLFQSEALRSGTIHSVYRRTINLLFGDQLVALQTADSPRSPISVLLPFEESEMPDVSGSCQMGNGVLQVANHTFSVGPETTVFPTLLEATSVDSEWLTESAVSILQRHPVGFARLYHPGVETTLEDELILSSVKSRLDRTVEFILARDYGAAAETLSSLIGVGTGLTPGGDDFLTGVLAGLWAVHGTHPLMTAVSDAVESHLQDVSVTNPISAAFLRCALDHRFSEAVLCFFAGDSRAEELFSSIGHSSGMDALCGIRYALELNFINVLREAVFMKNQFTGAARRPGQSHQRLCRGNGRCRPRIQVLRSEDHRCRRTDRPQP